MKYTMVSGILYDDKKALASVKEFCWNREKKIYSDDGRLQMQVHVEEGEKAQNRNSDIKARKYIITDGNGKPILKAAPHFAEGEDTALPGIPVYRMPRVDEAFFCYGGEDFRLLRHNSENFSLYDSRDQIRLQMFHRGIAGGWDISTDLNWQPELICGLFVLCKYIERENEFLTV